MKWIPSLFNTFSAFITLVTEPKRAMYSLSGIVVKCNKKEFEEISPNPLFSMEPPARIELAIY